MEEIIIAMKQVSKEFPGVKALQNIDLEICRGEIHGLVGENGAGKSTLIKILGGSYTATSGEVYMDGRKLQMHAPLDAQMAGISVVHQELKLVDALTVMENIYLGRWPKTLPAWWTGRACGRLPANFCGIWGWSWIRRSWWEI